MTDRHRSELQNITRCIRQHLPSASVLLFGRYADGKLFPETDAYHLLVVTDGAPALARAELARLLDLGYAPGGRLVPVINLLLMPVQAVNHEVSANNPFIIEALNEAIALFADPSVRILPREVPNYRDAARHCQVLFDLYYDNGTRFLNDAADNLRTGGLRVAAHGLRLAMEQFYLAVYTVFHGILPEWNNLPALHRLTKHVSAELALLLGWNPEGNNALINRLDGFTTAVLGRQALTFTPEELSECAGKLLQMQGLVKTLCQKRMEQLKEKAA